MDVNILLKLADLEQPVFKYLPDWLGDTLTKYQTVRVQLKAYEKTHAFFKLIEENSRFVESPQPAATYQRLLKLIADTTTLDVGASAPWAVVFQLKDASGTVGAEQALPNLAEALKCYGKA